MTKNDTNSKVKLYQFTACPFCWKVRTFLGLKKIPFETIEVNPMNKEEISFSKDWKKVPILVDTDGTQVNDSNDIMRYLEEKHPEPALFQNNEEEKKWLEWSETFVRAMIPLVYSSYKSALHAISYVTKFQKSFYPKRVLMKYMGAFFMWKKGKKVAAELGIQDPKAHFNSYLKEWAIHLKERPSKTALPNAAEVTIFGFLKNIEQLPAFAQVKAEPTVYNWYQTIDQTLNR